MTLLSFKIRNKTGLCSDILLKGATKTIYFIAFLTTLEKLRDFFILFVFNSQKSYFVNSLSVPHVVSYRAIFSGVGAKELKTRKQSSRIKTFISNHLLCPWIILVSLTYRFLIYIIEKKNLFFFLIFQSF